ncbi:uncharacterized protein LOC110686436 [Chenopodium quinoa]|uniref:uncharacterized protein LOC110686436 n=1 Tax=Chenopodium quinoa TaxID=63459 RepID=UPI000B798A5B|nr:uncharacterized protein LOC110686436 [Chenopodium quinoa]
MVISSSNNNNNEVILSDDEIDVANVLLDLPYLITNTLSSYRLSYDWGSKKRRSALVFPPSYSPPRCRRKVSAQLPPPPPPVKAEACSPNTPLSFSPSESDSKSVIDLDFKKKKQPPLNLRKKELEDSLKEKMVTQQHLKESVDKVREYRNSLMVENSILKARKHELLMPACTTTTRMEQQQHQQITTTVVNDRVHAIPSTSSEYHHQTPLIPSYDQRSPLISTFFQSNGGGNNWVHASPLHHQLNSGNNWGLQFQQYHNQSQPLILNHHGMVNDPVYAVAASGAMQMHCPAPLIPRHQNQRLLPDLNMEYKDQDQVCRERRAARLQANKEKRPRVNPAVK